MSRGRAADAEDRAGAGEAGAAMELGPEPPHRRRLLFAGSPSPSPAAARPLLGAPAAGGLSPVTTLTVTMDQLRGLGR